MYKQLSRFDNYRLARVSFISIKSSETILAVLAPVATMTGPLSWKIDPEWLAFISSVKCYLFLGQLFFPFSGLRSQMSFRPSLLDLQTRYPSMDARAWLTPT
ncbi:hypothetical protein DFH11DRAFT_1601091 [Phellopilus nigrolimitatus]|nr:hypothetical protein DFH11DRAFT_1601091 [Phellopilus nigrolimitatus]